MKLVFNRAIAACGVLLAYPASAAESGQQVYQQFCIACHGENGEGAGNGTFPPLAQSDWLVGSAERAIQILLHGLEGPVEVDGKVYNLAMPPQGALNDEQIAAVLSHVRSNFGNKEAGVTTKQVVNARKKSESRAKPWTAGELLKAYPFPKQAKVLKDVIMEVYHGKWEALPDFSQLEPDAVEEEHYGLFSLRNVAKKQEFGVVWQGEIMVPETADYGFEILVDDGARLSVAGEELLESDLSEAKGEWKIAKINLKKGANPIKLEYFQLDGAASVQLKFFGPGVSGKQLLTDKPKGRRKKVKAPVIDLTPSNEEAVMYNNFIAGTTSRAIGVGYPGGVNIAFSTENCAPELLWGGKFISGGRHWTGRGQGSESPLSKDVISLTKQLPYRSGLAADIDWKKQPELQYLGYTLDSKRFPTFQYRVGDEVVFEKVVPSKTGMKRHLKIESQDEGYFTVLLANSGAPEGKNTLLVDKKLKIESAQAISKGPSGFYTNLPLKKGTNTFTLNYTWH
ncbi:c-type cytochrome [Rubritalea sp.]|uniref:c-type cytochrome n=1 Tax=Rubritalea sp. TaxID=2109375 RepID=UPI003EF71C20